MVKTVDPDDPKSGRVMSLAGRSAETGKQIEKPLLTSPNSTY